MSSLRNAVKRRTHKERSQPAERRKFGLLEKKKDYVLRARDFHKKEEALKVLRKKAANRNPDEFYFAMQKQRTVDGVHNANQDESNKYTQDELHLMKTQDVKYVAMKASMEAKKVEKLIKKADEVMTDKVRARSIRIVSKHMLNALFFIDVCTGFESNVYKD